MKLGASGANVNPIWFVLMIERSANGRKHPSTKPKNSGQLECRAQPIPFDHVVNAT
jgi:hypothetical protein